MELPVRFPNTADVIADDARRFGALTNEQRIEAIRSLLDAGALMLENSPQSAFLRQYAIQQEDAWRKSIQEFLSRHGVRT
jgi:hypothetical protein